ncbi:unnamed protein product [Acanthoscelides obtectus]|nr:unnamed protein product [Acanthoscelides obtectus]CAK1629022.1 Mid1-interacting protein 1A [Acanthoscelides obtectus]
MERFVKSVNKMDETILVPCRLMDQKVGDEHDPAQKTQNTKCKHPMVLPTFHSSDLFHIYNMLNSAKDNLLWGQIEDTPKPAPKTTATTESTQVKGHIRRPSSISVASNSSTSTLSDGDSTDSESGSNDSGIEEPSVKEDKVQQIAQDFRKHLHDLTSSLTQMTEAAHYLTWRYQYDIGGPV